MLEGAVECVKAYDINWIFSLCLTEGQLRSIAKDEPFLFNVREGDQAYNQMHYNALGEVCIIFVCVVCLSLGSPEHDLQMG